MLFDLIGAVCSLLSTYYFIHMDNKAWGIGMIATCLNGGLYWYKGIYADMALESFYFFTMIYGWYQWQHNPRAHVSSLKQLNKTQALILTLSFSGGFALIYYILIHYTSSTVASLDAFTTTLSLVAQWLMCHKIIITWILWFITDAVYAWLYLSKNLPFHALLMLLYTGMAVIGYLSWARETKRGAIPQPLGNESL